MNVHDYGKFTRYRPEGEPPNYIFMQNEDGQDWYELLRRIAKMDGPVFVGADYPRFVAVEDGIVTNVEVDPTRLVPINRTILGTSDTNVRPGMLYRGGKFVLADEPNVYVGMGQ